MRKQDIVEEAKALCAAATPGPWAARPSVDRFGDNCEDVVARGHGNITVCAEIDRGFNEPFDDAAFIARARTLVPELVAEVKNQRALGIMKDTRIAELEAALKEALDPPSPSVTFDL